jgi:glycosyltransferase involved in cell wall biosynthesis
MSISTLVTVLMPVFNGERYLERAIQSILMQSLKDYKFFIIDDGSTDSSLEIINRYKEQDSRIQLLANSSNRGLIYTLNIGLDTIDTKYVARMDCDDVAFPTRLEKQVRLMEASPSIGVCGTWITVKNTSDGSEYTQRYPTRHANIKLHMLSYCAVAHPSVILRKSFFEQYGLRYDPAFIHAEDYELWTRAIDKFEFANIAEPLLEYTTHPENVSSKNEAIQSRATSKIRTEQVAKLICPKPKDETIITRLLTSGLPDALNQQDFMDASNLLERLLIANKKKKVYDTTLFDHFLFNAWYRMCKKCKIAEISPMREFLNSKISRHRGWFRFIYLSFNLSIKQIKRKVKSTF